MLHQTFLFLGQLWQLFEVSQILEFLRYVYFFQTSFKGPSISNGFRILEFEREENPGAILGPGCSKLTMLLVTVRLKFQPLIPEICQYFLWKNMRSFCNAKASLIFSTKNIMDYVIKL